MTKNIYLVSNTFKSFYLFRKEIIFSLSKKYNIILVANNDKYVNFFLEKKINCVKLNNLFNNRSILSQIIIISKFLFMFFKKKPNLVQTYTLHPNLLVSPIAKIFSAKTVLMITGMGAISISKYKFLKIAYNFLYKIISIFSDYFIYVNNHDRKYFTDKLNISKPYIQIFGAGITKKKKFKKNFISQKYNLKETFNILFIGRLIEEKNFEIAIKIFKKLNIKNKRLIIVGDFDELSFSKKKNYSILRYPGIIWLKKIDDVSQILFYSDLLLFPSNTEGMPTVLMEAINYNLPTVTYSIPGSEDIIKQNMNGYIHKVGDILSLENSIIKIFKSKKNSFERNYYKLRTRFSRNNIVNKINIFYDELLKE